MSAKLLGFEINNYTFEEALINTEKLIESGKPAQIVTINPEMFETASKNSEFADIIRNSEMVIPDGVGVEIALRLQGENVKRIPGIDFAKKLLEISAQKGYTVAITGAKEEIINSAINNLKNEMPNLNIVYFHNGYFKNDDEIYEDLKAANPQVILVAMGSPRQEEFIYKAKQVLSRGLMIGIGGSLDVWSGNIKRAPGIFQKTGTEWLYRTITQPERFKRIFPTLPLFIIKTMYNKDK